MFGIDTAINYVNIETSENFDKETRSLQNGFGSKNDLSNFFIAISFSNMACFSIAEVGCWPNIRSMGISND